MVGCWEKMDGEQESDRWNFGHPKKFAYLLDSTIRLKDFAPHQKTELKLDFPWAESVGYKLVWPITLMAWNCSVLW